MFNLTAALNLIIPTSQVQRATAQINSALNQSTSNAVSFADAVALKGKGFAAYAVASAAIVRVSESFSKATRDAIRFEFELAKIAQTVEMSNRQVKEHAASIQNVAVEYGLSAAKVAETIRVLAQAGYSFKEAKKGADALAATTLLGSFDSIADTTDGLIAVMKQFNLTMADSEKVLGLLNVVSKKYAVESSDLVEAVRKAGGTFSAMGGNLQELISLFTTVRDTTRESAETIATGFRTIFARLARPKTIEYFRELGIELTDLKGNLKSPQQAIIAIQQGLERLGITAGSVKFAEIVEEIGGIRQASRVIPLLTQAEKLSRITQDANGAIGSFSEDVAKAQDTLYYKIINLQQAFSRMVSEVIDTKSFKIFADVLFGLANAAIELARSLKQLLPLLLAIGAIKIGGALRKGISSQGLKGFFFNRGGVVPGTGNSDTVPAMLTPGEFVIRKSAVEAFGADKLHAINKYADGGIIEASSLYSPTLRNKINDPNITPDQYETGEYINRKDKITFNKVSYGISGVKKVGNKTRVMNAEEFEKYAAQKFGRTLASGVDGNPNAPVDLIGGSFPIEVRNRNELTSDSVLADKFIRHKMSGNKNTKFLANKVDEDTISLKGKIGIVYNTAKLTTDQSKGLRKPRSKRKANGGGITGTDTVPALLTPGEFVVNKRSAEAFGYGNLKKINKYAKGGIVRKFANGGEVSGGGEGFSIGLTEIVGFIAALSVIKPMFKEIENAGKAVKEAYNEQVEALEKAKVATEELASSQEEAVKPAYSINEDEELKPFNLNTKVETLAEKTNKSQAAALDSFVPLEDLSFPPEEPLKEEDPRKSMSRGLYESRQGNWDKSQISREATDQFSKNMEANTKALSQAAADSAEALTEAGKTIKSSIGTAASKASSGLKLAGSKLWSGTKSAGGWAKEKVKTAGGWAKEKLTTGRIGSALGTDTPEGRANFKANTAYAAGALGVGAISKGANYVAENYSKARDTAIAMGDEKDAKEYGRQAAVSQVGADASGTLGAIGAGIGSLFGPLGTVIGGVVGAFAGFLMGLETVQAVLDFFILGINGIITGLNDWLGIFGISIPTIETFGESADKAAAEAEKAAKAEKEKQVSEKQTAAVLQQINSQLINSFVELKNAVDKAQAIEDLGNVVNNLASSSFRSTALSSGIDKNDKSALMASAKITGATGAVKNLMGVSSAQETFNEASRLKQGKKITDEEFQKRVKQAGSAVGVDIQGNVTEEDLSKIQEGLKSAESQYKDMLMKAAQSTENAFNRYLDAVDNAASAQIEYNNSVIDFAENQRDASKMLQSYRVGGSTVQEMRQRVSSYGLEGVSSAGLRQKTIAQSAQLSNTGVFIAQAQSAGAGRSEQAIKAGGDFGALQIAQKSNIALLQQDTKIRQQLIAAMQEELNLEKQRASAFDDFATALSGGEGAAAQQAAMQAAADSQMLDAQMEMAKKTGDYSGTISTLGMMADSGTKSTVMSLLSPEKQELLKKQQSLAGASMMQSMGLGDMATEAMTVAQTGFTSRGAEIAGNIQAQQGEVAANDEAMLQLQKDSADMLLKASMILEASVGSIAGHFTNFGDRLTQIVDSLKNTSINMNMEPTNIAVSFNNAESLNAMNENMRQIAYSEVNKAILAMKEGRA